MPEPRPLARSLAVRLVEARCRKSFPELIAARRAAGKSFREIGAEFGLSHTTLYRHWRKHQAAQKLAAP